MIRYWSSRSYTESDNVIDDDIDDDDDVEDVTESTPKA